jgi:hypothetical protein
LWEIFGAYALLRIGILNQSRCYKGDVGTLLCDGDLPFELLWEPLVIII